MADIPPPGMGSLPGFDELFSQLYQELRLIAHRQRLRHGLRHTLCTTAIVNETYLRLKGAGRLTPEDRLHFLALSARAMRFVLVDYARRWTAEKRGRGRAVGGDEVVDLASPTQNVESTLAVHAALERLSERNERMARVVECRFFGGMTEEEIGQLLGVSERTVRGDWQRAKLWLTRDLAVSESPS
jgi:RNA polymerase sigma factor (TIGR02999 family)